MRNISITIYDKTDLVNLLADDPKPVTVYYKRPGYYSTQKFFNPDVFPNDWEELEDLLQEIEEDKYELLGWHYNEAETLIMKQMRLSKVV
jgi:hypothetical protein